MRLLNDVESAKRTRFFLIGGGAENAIIPSVILETYKDMEDMLKELGKETKEFELTTDDEYDVRGLEYVICDDEIVENKEFVESLQESLSLCEKTNEWINELLDSLDKIMVKGENDEKLIAQVELIYDKIHSLLSFAIEEARECQFKMPSELWRSGLLFRSATKITIKENITIGDTLRTRKRKYMQWIHQTKECMASILEDAFEHQI